MKEHKQKICEAPPLNVPGNERPASSMCVFGDFWLSKALYLTEPDGVVVGLGSRVEVDGLLDVIVALVVSSQVVRRRPVPRVVGYLRCLAEKINTFSHLWTAHDISFNTQQSRSNTSSSGHKASHLLDVPHVAVHPHQREVILSALIEAQRRVHVGLALQVLGPPLIDAPAETRGGCNLL